MLTFHSEPSRYAMSVAPLPSKSAAIAPDSELVILRLSRDHACVEPLEIDQAPFIAAATSVPRTPSNSPKIRSEIDAPEDAVRVHRRVFPYQTIHWRLRV